MDNKHLKRAGLDYWHEVDVRHHESFKSFLREEDIEKKITAFSKYGALIYTQAEVKQGDYLLFGQETLGLPEDIREKYPCVRVPIWGNVRSLNLSTSVGIVVYHYLHEMGRF